MDKNSKLLLEDYLKDPTQMRLFLFASRVSPNFKLTKANSPALAQLILDYQTDPKPVRLKNIETFLGNVPLPKNRIKPSDMKKMSTVQSQTVKKEKTEFDKKREELGRLKATPGWGENSSLRDKIFALQEEVNELDRQQGGFDPQPPEATYLAIVIGAVGHWEDPNSIAYELIHGTQPRITLDSGQNFNLILDWLQQFSGKPLRPWIVQTNKGYGTMQGKFKEQVILTDQRSGLPLIKENNVSLRISDGQVTEDNGVGAQTLSAIPPIPNVGAVGKVTV